MSCPVCLSLSQRILDCHFEYARLYNQKELAILLHNQCGVDQMESEMASANARKEERKADLSAHIRKAHPEEMAMAAGGSR